MDSELICPKCAKPVPLDPPYWSLMGKFYCSEFCARPRRSIFV